jgi:hypothetical protein
MHHNRGGETCACDVGAARWRVQASARVQGPRRAPDRAWVAAAVSPGRGCAAGNGALALSSSTAAGGLQLHMHLCVGQQPCMPAAAAPPVAAGVPAARPEAEWCSRSRLARWDLVGRDGRGGSRTTTGWPCGIRGTSEMLAWLLMSIANACSHVCNHTQSRPRAGLEQEVLKFCCQLPARPTNCARPSRRRRGTQRTLAGNAVHRGAGGMTDKT